MGVGVLDGIEDAAIPPDAAVRPVARLPFWVIRVAFTARNSLSNPTSRHNRGLLACLRVFR